MEERAEYLPKRWRPLNLPRFGLGREQRQHQNDQRHSEANKEHRLPAKVRRNRLHSDRGQQISERISTLHHAGEEATLLQRRTLHRVRSANAPITAHPKAIEK